ncbi:MAG: hypothetical protein ACRD0K_27105 [Egibacteraceae bacterium]
MAGSTTGQPYGAGSATAPAVLTPEALKAKLDELGAKPREPTRQVDATVAGVKRLRMFVCCDRTC